MASTRLKPADWVRVSLIAIALLYAFFAGLRTVADFDLGWQIATGRYIVQHHSIPSTEVFSYTAHGNPWLYPPFSGVILYALFVAGGFAALSWLSALACVTTTALIAIGRSRIAGALAIVAVPAIALRTIPRAELFTTIFFAAFATLLWRYYEGRSARLWLLPLIMIAWVNLHPGFVAGLALVGAYVLVEALDLPFADRRGPSLVRLRAAVPWIAATGLATLANPWGWKIYESIARQSEMTQLHTDFIGEWSGVHFSSAAWLQAVSFRDPASGDWWMLAVALVAVVTSLVRKEVGAAIILAVGSYASLTHIRLQGVFAILVCIVGGSVFSRAWPSREGKSTAPASQSPAKSRKIQARAIAAWALAAVLALLVVARVRDLVTDRYYLWSAQITLFGTGPSWWFPEQAMAFLHEQHLPGNLFGDYNLGGYLTWRAGPEYPVYFDGRFIPLGRDLFVRHATLVSLPLDSPEWQQEAGARDIQTAIFSVARFGGLGISPLQPNCQSKTWTPVYLDDVAIIFVRNSPQNSVLTQRLAINCETVALRPPDAAAAGNSWRASAERFQFLMSAASIEYVLARDSEAISNLEQAEAIFADDPNEHFLKGQLAQAHGQLAIAENAYRAAIRLRPTDAAWFALAGLLATEQRYPEAVHAVLESAALSQEPYDRYRALGKLYVLMNRPQEALAAFAKAAHDSPYHGDTAALGTEFNARVAEGESAAYLELADSDRAIASQLKAVKLTPLNAKRWQTLADLYSAAGRADLASAARQKAAALESAAAPPTPALPKHP
jgi:tetratricopeptide (TPR) repeat protein